MTQPGFLDNYLAFLLAKASHGISAGFHRELKKRGVSIGTWRVLASLSDGPCTVGDLAGFVLLNQPTMSKTLDRLAQEGLLERTRDNENRRSVQIALTARGRRMAAELIPLANAHETQAFAHLSAAERRQLIAFLRRTIRRLEPATPNAAE